MSKEIWFVSDTHFCHKNIITFRDNSGNLIRPFDSVEEMDEHMIARWNEVVKPGDKVYHLGDVIMGQGTPKIQQLLPRLTGAKRLLLGNHDTQALKSLVPHFQKIGLWRIFKDEGFICTHIPLMPEQFRHKVSYNVHGHMHQNKMADQTTYLNVCVENTDYRPISMGEVLETMRQVRQ